jgi:hypothetical protein
LKIPKHVRYVVWVLICLIAFDVAAADIASVSGKPSSAIASIGHDLGPAADGIKGLVVNQTITASGYDFYRIFSILWSEKPDSNNYSLSVQERRSLRRNNQVGIFLGQKQIFSAMLPSKHDGLNELGEKAANEILANIIALMIESVSDDIAREEL